MLKPKYPEQFTKSGHLAPVTDDEINAMIKECVDELNESTTEVSLETGDTIVDVSRYKDDDERYIRVMVITKKCRHIAMIDI